MLPPLPTLTLFYPPFLLFMLHVIETAEVEPSLVFFTDNRC